MWQSISNYFKALFGGKKTSPKEPVQLPLEPVKPPEEEIKIPWFWAGKKHEGKKEITFAFELYPSSLLV